MSQARKKLFAKGGVRDKEQSEGRERKGAEKGGEERMKSTKGDLLCVFAVQSSPARTSRAFTFQFLSVGAQGSEKRGCSRLFVLKSVA